MWSRPQAEGVARQICRQQERRAAQRIRPAFLPKSGSGPNAKGRRFPRPNGYLVYLAEAAGRERSPPDLLTTRAASRTAYPPGVSAKKKRLGYPGKIEHALQCRLLAKYGHTTHINLAWMGKRAAKAPEVQDGRILPSLLNLTKRRHRR